MSASARLKELGIELPEVAKPLASYVPAVRSGNLVYTSGQLPMQAGKLAATGKLGDDVTPEQGKALARICTLNALAAVDSLVGIDAVTQVVKVVGFVASAPGFNGQPGVANGAPPTPPPLGGRRRRAATGLAGGGRTGGGGRLTTVTDVDESLTHPAYGRLRPVTDTASVLLANNPGLMTLEGTNTWVLRGEGRDEIGIIDPGPDDDEHIAKIAGLGRIAVVLISHRHGDHTDAIDKLVDLTGAPVRSAGSGFLRGLSAELTDGEVIGAAGLRITVLATPGHTADSLSFVLDDAVLTADTVLGRGTTVIDAEDGSLAAYLDSLHRLRGLGGRTVLPGHGPDLPNLEPVASGYLMHRHERLEQVRAALWDLGSEASTRESGEYVYVDVDEKLWDAAEWSVK